MYRYKLFTNTVLNDDADLWDTITKRQLHRVISDSTGFTVNQKDEGLCGDRGRSENDLRGLCTRVRSPRVWSALSFPLRRSRPPTGTESAAGETGSCPGGWSALWSGSATRHKTPLLHLENMTKEWIHYVFLEHLACLFQLMHIFHFFLLLCVWRSNAGWTSNLSLKYTQYPIKQ